MWSDEEFKKKQRQKYQEQSRQFKVYLYPDKDADIIAKLEAEPKMTRLIRKALIWYLRDGEDKE